MPPSIEVNEYVLVRVRPVYRHDEEANHMLSTLFQQTKFAHGTPLNALDIRSAANILQTTVPFDLFHSDSIPSFGFFDCHILTQMMPLYIEFKHSTEITNDVRFRTNVCHRCAQNIRPMHRVNGGYGSARKCCHELTFICVMCKDKNTDSATVRLPPPQTELSKSSGLVYKIKCGIFMLTSSGIIFIFIFYS